MYLQSMKTTKFFLSSIIFEVSSSGIKVSQICCLVSVQYQSITINIIDKTFQADQNHV